MSKNIASDVLATAIDYNTSGKILYTPAQLKAKGEEYFATKGVKEDGVWVIDKYVSTTALAHFVGYSKQHLWVVLRKKEGYSEVVEYFHEVLEDYLERQLAIKTGSLTGIMMIVKNRYHWRDKPVEEANKKLPGLSDLKSFRQKNNI
jgi:hypothetical protein